jgi:hypothetical protein
MNPGSPVCLQFWYHMYGQGIGTLSVILITKYEGKKVWIRKSELGDRWVFGQVGMNPNETFKVCVYVFTYRPLSRCCYVAATS